jgi:naringenin degradation protein FdeH
VPLSKEVRRVVTTHDETGQAVVLFDGSTPHRIEFGPGRPVLHDIWCTEGVPVDMKGKEDPVSSRPGRPPSPDGSVIRVLDIPPIGDVSKLDLEMMQSQLGPEHSHPKARKPRHPMMHRTRTIDYIIVLSGEIDMLLDEGEVHLQEGDIVVQQATNHAWVNRGTEVCRICTIMLGGKEPLA